MFCIFCKVKVLRNGRCLTLLIKKLNFELNLHKRIRLKIFSCHLNENVGKSFNLEQKTSG